MRTILNASPLLLAGARHARILESERLHRSLSDSEEFLLKAYQMEYMDDPRIKKQMIALWPEEPARIEGGGL